MTTTTATVPTATGAPTLLIRMMTIMEFLWGWSGDFQYGLEVQWVSDSCGVSAVTENTKSAVMHLLGLSAAGPLHFHTWAVPRRDQAAVLLFAQKRLDAMHWTAIRVYGT